MAARRVGQSGAQDIGSGEEAHFGSGEEVHFELGAQLRVVQFLEGARQRVADVVDDDIEAAEPGDRVIQYQAQRTGVGDVHAHGAQAPGKGGGKRLRRLVVAGDRDHSLT
ncbi:hypothetical protein Srubr_19490 [Streptomyces rubradiris]|uniref:Uncharacterized protein n=1 Tax=Streptomyces rubradiris TaxID=285531 RepID=A0ABQ3R8C2_STRRR|nr:hypothetical protein [Streptomyces rubradiris]GHH23036.1 hypothetical protein GCM10018792_59230 [Streptomyces rubradiris]GHI52103.1 hypothetical protein Srubr_19490 [Streptomyces rubradiris]